MEKPYPANVFEYLLRCSTPSSLPRLPVESGKLIWPEVGGHPGMGTREMSAIRLSERKPPNPSLGGGQHSAQGCAGSKVGPLPFL